MQRVTGSIWGGAAGIGLERRGLGWNGREPGSRKIREAAQILWKNNFINLAITAFLPVTCHVVIAELHLIEF
jgi:hypothetical protein